MMNVWIWPSVVALILLIPCSVQDIRTRTVPAWWLAAGSAVALCMAGWLVHSGETEMVNLAFAGSPGVFLLALSMVTEQQIGMADGICAMILGMLIGSPWIYITLVISLILSSVCAGVLLMSRKGNSRTRMPWIPFLTAGHLLLCVMRVCGA